MAVDGFKGQTVKVRPLLLGERDKFGNRARGHGGAIEVADVLVAPADCAAAIEEGSPYGAIASFTLYVPKGADVAWRGALVEIGGEDFAVVGDPRPYPEGLVPTGRNLVVTVARHEGS